ncbi:MAG: GNAT family N-acetyltransferase [Tannerellaceae bacterium]|jgi:ribosomal protein S18 acetylase RimI-like enzyme|nr:GNAT family N-acetyltransferase [Tannerellaceae bacterium]
MQFVDDLTLRLYRENDREILEDLLYEAIFQPEGCELLPRDIISRPDLSVYIQDFGEKADDHCLLAQMDDEIIGGVWTRILSDNIKGYGNIDACTPEFSIAVLRKYRNKGVGTVLMREMIDLLANRGYAQASLSVDKENYAIHIYKKLGFKVFRENIHDYIMLLKLTK